MKLKFYLIVCLIISFSIQTAFSGQDRVLINSTLKSDLYILSNTIKATSPNIRQYWDYEIYKEDIEQNGKILYHQNEYAKSLRKINCKEDTSTILDILIYNENGTIKRSSRGTEPTIWTAIVPESLGSEIQTYICSKKIK